MGASANRNSEQRNAKRAFIADLQLLSANSFAALAPRSAAGSLRLGTSVGQPEIAVPPRAIVLIAPSWGAGVLSSATTWFTPVARTSFTHGCFAPSSIWRLRNLRR